jgi:Cohesin domain/FlgD Ig-like domain
MSIASFTSVTAILRSNEDSFMLRPVLKNHSSKDARHIVALLVFALALFSFPIDATGAVASGNFADPGIRDTVRIESVEGLRGSAVVVPVNFFADEILGGITLVLRYDPVVLNLDSVSFTGTLSEPLSIRIVNIDSTNGILDGAAFSFDSANVIQPGAGVLANLHFRVSDSAPAGVYVIDTTTVNPPGPAILQTSFSTVQTDSIGNETVLPAFTAGSVTVADRAATFDSIWVDTVTGAQGETVIVDVFLHNELPLVIVKIPLRYASPKLLFDTVLFSGTRGILAGQSRQSQVNTDSQEVLITLEYLDSAPLTPGDGPIARLRFTIDNTAPNDTFAIDSASYLGVVPLELITTIADGSFRFTPIFHPGAIIVDFRTDVGDDDHPTLPTEFKLRQNFPNPFNPTTKIGFSLPRGSDVTLEVYNLLGQKIRTLVRGYRQQGDHVVEFDGLNEGGGSVASGIYFYRIKTDAKSETRKMTLLK